MALSIYNLTISTSTGNIIYFMMAFSFFIYILGRLYGLFTLRKDYVEITKEHLKFRSTPPFGQGWLPKNREIPLSSIKQADIIQIVPFQDPDQAIMALELRENNGKRLIVGNNLSQDQIIKIGLALKGTVTLSNALQRILGKDDVGDQLRDLVDMGKSLWNSFKKNQGGQ